MSTICWRQADWPSESTCWQHALDLLSIAACDARASPLCADFLTKIDSVIIMTTSSIAFAGIASQVLVAVHADSGEQAADYWNQVLWIGVSTLYVVLNILIFIPAWLRQSRSVARMHERSTSEAIEYAPWGKLSAAQTSKSSAGVNLPQGYAPVEVNPTAGASTG